MEICRDEFSQTPVSGAPQVDWPQQSRRHAGHLTAIKA
jgi:hypothetical protein